MRQALSVILITIVAFAAGMFAGQWWEQHRPLPPPPGMLGSEFSHRQPPYFGGFHREHPFDRAELRREIEALRPQIEAFRAKMQAIDAEFDGAFSALLNPQQRAERERFLQRRRDHEARREAGMPERDHILFHVGEESARSILWDVVVPLRLDLLTRVYKLDDEQREKTRALLLTRRQKVIELIDASPPPSVMLSRIADWIQSSGHPAHSPAP